MVGQSSSGRISLLMQKPTLFGRVQMSACVILHPTIMESGKFFFFVMMEWSILESE